MRKTACWDSDLDLLLITGPKREVTSADRLALKDRLLETEAVFEVCI